MTRFPLVVAGLLLLASPALAQQSGPVRAVAAAPDPRLAGPQVNALQAMLGLREAELRALAEDMQKKLAEREQEWSDSFKGWCGERPACGLVAPQAETPQPAE